MPRAGQRLKTRRPAAVKPAGPAHKTADALAGNRLVRYMEQHFEWMLVSGYSPETIRARRQAIRKFIVWADERGLDDPREVTRPMIERYQRHLFYYRKPDTPKGRKDAGAALTVGMQVQYLAPLKTWFRWLAREHHILANPAADIDLPRQPKRLPRSVPSVQEVEAMLAEAEPANAQGLRDRALLEVLYATGLRRMEIVAWASTTWTCRAACCGCARAREAASAWCRSATAPARGSRSTLPRLVRSYWLATPRRCS